MSKRNLIQNPALYVVLAIYIALTYAVLAMGNSVIAATIPEDHLFEIVGAGSLFITAVLFLYAFLVARKTMEKTRGSLVKQLVYLGLATLFFFGAGEEISWGQRILGFETPEVLTQINKQEEFNAHNLTVWQDTTGFDANRLFDIFWFSFAVLTPAAALVAPSFKRVAGKFIPIVFWGIGLAFVYNYLWAKLAKILFRTSYAFERIQFAQAVQEIKESNYAVIFILVGLFVVLNQKRS
jgi:hypothetical protein